MWKVQFNDYLKFDGVKENIKEIKQRVKRSKFNIELQGIQNSGYHAEATAKSILEAYHGFRVKELSPQYDIGFGADLQVSYMKGENNFSFFLDVATKEKHNVEYLSMKGDTVEDIQDAFAYETEYFKAYFAVKNRHYSYFFYEKPVVVLYLENYVPTTGLAVSHVNNIANLLISLNDLLYEMGYNARASAKITPNPKKYPEEYRNAHKQLQRSFD